MEAQNIPVPSPVGSFDKFRAMEGPGSLLNRNEFAVHSELVSHSRRESQALLHPSSSTFLPSSTHQDVLYQQQLLLPPTPLGHSTSFRLKVQSSCQVREPRPRSTRTLEDLHHFNKLDIDH
jgi:hypothetical protein